MPSTKRDPNGPKSLNTHKVNYSCRTELILQPAPFRDVCCDPVFPTPALKVCSDVCKRMGRRLHSLPEPCVVRINGVEIALTSSEARHCPSQQKRMASLRGPGEPRQNCSPCFPYSQPTLIVPALPSFTAHFTGGMSQSVLAAISSSRHNCVVCFICFHKGEYWKSYDLETKILWM
ncbi:hypothetical protein ANCCEY_04802 [Ancylostoma ceylanicum]|uniref:Uncharacterized protein n=1 Tax=Ancylostoma ceylanicum TaxID=53326 RepID=A0A0D6M1A8_9BILA|nr:hypothetical protein ANCCEY_04802 [Ancylostoma ceylanicum]